MITAENIVFIEYDGANRPFQVWTDNSEMYDVRFRRGYFEAEWSGGGLPYVHKHTLAKKPRKLWFKEFFRPKNGGVLGNIPLQNRDLVEFGFTIIESPTHIEEIVEAINNY